MKNWSNKIQIAFLSVVVLMQLFVFLSPIQVQAQPNPIGGPLQLPIPGVNEPAATTPASKPLVPDAIDVTKQAPTELPVYNAGVDRSIQDYLCTPTGTGTDLYDCVDRLYRFGISAGAIIVVFFIIYAGYIYITGGEASKTKAKQTLYAAFTGMGIMLGSFILLNFINPSLVQIKTIQPPIFNAADLPSCEVIGFSENCLITSGSSAGQVYNAGGGGGETGQCTEANLKSCSWNVNEALTICKAESGGNTGIEGKADPCGQVTDSKTGTTTQITVPITMGLFQMSPALAGDNGVPECKNVLTYGGASDPAFCMVPIKVLSNGMKYCPKRKCTAPSGMDALNKCLNLLKSKEGNINSACSAWKKQCWQPWSTRSKLTSKTCNK